mmetsp:Transcript_50611/g.128778  ORF Transcript_50611/g.128778 Transcript_50611/m.128778 type:complete len:243 (+) Transcript_50611:118-846(+)
MRFSIGRVGKAPLVTCIKRAAAAERAAAAAASSSSTSSMKTAIPSPPMGERCGGGGGGGAGGGVAAAVVGGGAGGLRTGPAGDSVTTGAPEVATCDFLTDTTVGGIFAPNAAASEGTLGRTAAALSSGGTSKISGGLPKCKQLAFAVFTTATRLWRRWQNLCVRKVEAATRGSRIIASNDKRNTSAVTRASLPAEPCVGLSSANGPRCSNLVQERNPSKCWCNSLSSKRPSYLSACRPSWAI